MRRGSDALLQITSPLFHPISNAKEQLGHVSEVEHLAHNVCSNGLQFNGGNRADGTGPLNLVLSTCMPTPVHQRKHSANRGTATPDLSLKLTYLRHWTQTSQAV